MLWFSEGRLSGDFVYLSDTFLKALISTRVKTALDKYEIEFLLIWFRLGMLHLQAVLVINPVIQMEVLARVRFVKCEAKTAWSE